MKREGRQHGMVRAYSIMSAPWNPRPNRGHPNELTTPPTAGMFTKVSTKPTNHSKFTGKCGRSMCRGCRDHPVCKSKDKVKGAHKIRSSSNVGSDYRFVTWRVVDARPGLKFSGLSATGVLDYLAGDDYSVHDYEGDYNQDYPVHYYEGDYNEDNDVEVEELGSYNHEIEEIGEHGVLDYGVDDDNNDDLMSYCEVGFAWQPLDGDESWCLVEEL